MNVLVPGQNEDHQTLQWFFSSLPLFIVWLIAVLAALMCFAAMSVIALRKIGLV